MTKMHDLVLADRRLKAREIAKTVGNLKSRVGHILHEILSMRKLSARWMPRLLTPNNKRNPKESLHSFVTVDETWIHWYILETKEQSKQWTSPGKRAPKKAKAVLSAGKVMATIFGDSQGVIYIDYLQKGKTVTGLYYAELLGGFDGELQKKRPHLAKEKVLFHHDNVPAQSFAVATAKLIELGYELLPHPPYFPDLAPCDFFLFPNSLVPRKFELNEEVIATMEACFADLQKTYFSEGLKKLEHQWVKCIELKGDYVEK